MATPRDLRALRRQQIREAEWEKAEIERIKRFRETLPPPSPETPPRLLPSPRPVLPSNYAKFIHTKKIDYLDAAEAFGMELAELSNREAVTKKYREILRIIHPDKQNNYGLEYLELLFRIRQCIYLSNDWECVVQLELI